LYKEEGADKVVGDCVLKTNIEFDSAPSRIRATLTSGPIKFGDTSLVTATKVSFNRTQEKWDGLLFAALNDQQQVGGTFSWNEVDGTGRVKANNKTRFAAPFFNYWSVLPDALTTDVRFNSDGAINGSYHCTATHEKAETTSVVAGTFSWDDIFSCTGELDHWPFSLSCSLKPSFNVHRCTYCDNEGRHIINLHAHQQYRDKFVGSIAFPFIKNLLKKIDYNVQGEGAVNVYGSIKDEKLFLQLNLVDGAIRIADTYNFINGLKARFIVDPYARNVTMKKFDCSLHRGHIGCNQAVVFFDNDYAVEYAHIPLVFNDCLLNWKKDLFAVVSGHMIYSRSFDDKMRGKLKGHVVVDRGQLKQNIFSHDFQQRFFSLPGSAIEDQSKDVSVDLAVQTKEPVRIKTSFLETSATLNLTVGGSFLHPKLNGKIGVLSGHLAFPYKPLHIAHGLIDFSSGQLDNPLINLSANNKIKKYNVKLDVSGSLKQQDIVLYSTPNLTQEQIISLLLAGSEQESLNILMPALIMQNIKGIMFGADHSSTGVRSAFSKLFKPFERIHLVPSFTDQTGRGGLRGAIEIDVSERWRAMIQKNFSLTEDTKVEVEYLLSDDVSLRGVRDERGDMSAEVEMRWKF